MMNDKKIHIFLLISCFFVSFFCGTVFCFAQKWLDLGSEHFIVYFTQDEKLAQKVVEGAESNYRRITEDLDYPRYSDFWLWDNRAKIYIYPDQESYLKATGQPSWSQGVAEFEKKEIITYAWHEDFIESLLPHEMAHLIFRNFVGFSELIPLWLDEGVAQWAEVEKREEMKKMAEKYHHEDKWLLISDLMNLKIDLLKEKDRIYIRPTRTKDNDEGVLFLDTESLIDTYYLQAFSVVGFLIERYGSKRFGELCRQLRDGKGVESSLKFAYPANINSLNDLEALWRESLN